MSHGYGYGYHLGLEFGFVVVSFGVLGYGFGISSWLGPGLCCGVMVMGLVGIQFV